MSYLVDTAIGVARIVVGFYGFWFVWRALAPILPGPRQERERVARFAYFFTDPLVEWFANGNNLLRRVVIIGWLVIVAALLTGFDRLAAM